MDAGKPYSKVFCPSCGAKYGARPEWAGRAFTCKRCSARVEVPADLSPPEPAAEEAVREAEAARDGARDIDVKAVETYKKGHSGVKEVLARARDRGQEILTGKKGYEVGDGTLMIVKGAGLKGEEGVDALRKALEAERAATGQVNPVKEALVDGFVVGDYDVRFAGDEVATLKKKPWKDADGVFHFVTARPVPYLFELQERYRGLDAAEAAVVAATRALDFRRGRQVRAAFKAAALTAPSTLYDVVTAAMDQGSGLCTYALRPAVVHREDEQQRLRRVTGR